MPHIRLVRGDAWEGISRRGLNGDVIASFRRLVSSHRETLEPVPNQLERRIGDD
ncbi:hypothetical protein [Tautonia sociabilis]|uniref:hypothetical protein n=1 Tax=Tautonia sociabilis TaxID=2080755 RepID=UPI001315853E|nr:hypothetical protein [Tautonia sociabilis]